MTRAESFYTIAYGDNVEAIEADALDMAHIAYGSHSPCEVVSVEPLRPLDAAARTRYAAGVRLRCRRVTAPQRMVDCPHCEHPSAMACGPDGDHLARYIKAWQDGHLGREALTAAVAEMTVIHGSVSVPSDFTKRWVA